MATPRKRWFKVADAILREPWDDWTLATVVRLMAWLNQRRARDGKDGEEVGEALIGELDAMTITNLRRPHVAVQRLASLPLDGGLTSASASLEKTQSGSRVRLKWSKYAEFQRSVTRESADIDPDAGSSDSDSDLRSPTPAPGLREEPPKPPSQGGAPALELNAPKRRTRKRQEPKPETDPPEAYTVEELDKLRAWCQRTPDVRGQIAKLEALAEACLIHHRKKGLRSCDWYASAQTWIRRDLEFHPIHSAAPVPEPTREQIRAREIERMNATTSWRLQR